MPLPDHLEKDIADFVEKASYEGFDKVSGRKFEERSKNTRDGYRAALRYLLTTLGKAGVPIAKMNRLETVLTDANIIEAVRWTAEHIEDVNSISNRTAAQYFGAIVTVAARNDVDVDDMFQTVRKSAFLAEGAAMSKEMCGSTLRISRRVVEGHMRQQTFDGWIARATSAVGMRMTAHKFRCVQASILLHIDWNNLLIAAHLVGNTPKTCATFYGWINEEDLMSKAQAARGRAKAEVEECVETYE